MILSSLRRALLILVSLAIAVGLGSEVYAQTPATLPLSGLESLTCDQGGSSKVCSAATLGAYPGLAIDSYLPASELPAIRNCTSTYDIRTALAQAEADAVVNTTPGAYGQPSRDIVFGPGCYYFGGHYSIQHGVTFRGVAHKGVAAGNTFATTWTFPTNTDGVYFDSYWTLYGVVQSSPRSTTSEGAAIEGITIYGSTSQAAGDGIHNGVSMYTSATLTDFNVDNFGGTCIYIFGDTAHSNVDGWQVRNGSIFICGKYGIYVKGPDGNVGHGENLIVQTTAGACIADRSFLGNTWTATNTADCDGITQTPASGVASLASYSGHIFVCLDDGQCPTSAPTVGSYSSPWNDLGTPSLTAVPWTSGQAYLVGGPYFADDPNARSVFTGTYMELQNVPAHVVPPSFMVGGLNSGDAATSTLVGTNVGLTGSYGVGVKSFVPGTTTPFLSALAGSSSEVLNGTILTWTFNNENQWRRQYTSVRSTIDDDWCDEFANVAPIFCGSGPSTLSQFGTGVAQPFRPFTPAGIVIGGRNDGRLVSFGSAPPTAGTHAAGEIVFNNVPSGFGSAFAWVNVSTGTPGTWYPLYIGTLPSYTVSTLPTCGAGLKGANFMVTDATAVTYNAAPTGGGALTTPVFCNGSSWAMH